MRGNASNARRLEDLEERVRQRQPERSTPSEARRRMTERLNQLARFRRGELGPEEEAECRALIAAVESRLASNQGEGLS